MRHFVFEAETDRLEFTPGQFVSLTEKLGDKQVTRAYSIASAPDQNRFELCLNCVEDGLFSPHLFAMQPGETVELKGPLGYFVLRDPLSDSIFVATGTGIAPFRSILADPRLAESPHRFTLIFGARYEHGLLYHSEFLQLDSAMSNFEYRPTITRPDEAWTGRTGRVQAHVIEAVGDRRDLDVYICGLKEMVDDVRRILKELGFDRRRIIYEKYD